MSHKPKTILNPKKRYLQVALNSTLEEAQKIISRLPVSDRIIIEAGTPFIKRYGEAGIRQIREWYEKQLSERFLMSADYSASMENLTFSSLFQNALKNAKTSSRRQKTRQQAKILPYIAADLKTMDRGETETQTTLD